MSDYIHRVGRVGRVGSRKTGSVISFISHVWEVDLLWKIEVRQSAQTNTQLFTYWGWDGGGVEGSITLSTFYIF